MLAIGNVADISVQKRERTAETTNPIQCIIVGTWFRHYHAFVGFGIECNGNVSVVTFLPFRCNLLNEHLADFALFPVGDVVEGIVHTTDTL